MVALVRFPGDCLLDWPVIVILMLCSATTTKTTTFLRLFLESLKEAQNQGRNERGYNRQKTELRSRRTRTIGRTANGPIPFSWLMLGGTTSTRPIFLSPTTLRRIVLARGCRVSHFAALLWDHSSLRMSAPIACIEPRLMQLQTMTRRRTRATIPCDLECHWERFGFLGIARAHLLWTEENVAIVDKPDQDCNDLDKSLNYILEPAPRSDNKDDDKTTTSNDNYDSYSGPNC